MKTRIILSIVMLFSLLGAKAQEAVETKIFPANQIIAPHQIEVTFQKTVHILFPSEVRYVDLGSFDIIADKAMGAENVVRIKAAVKGFEGETNFSVITADGCFYSFNVVYKDEPAQLSIEMEDWLRDNPEGGKLRIGHGFYERDPQKSFWNYLWKTSFAGVTDIVM